MLAAGIKVVYTNDIKNASRRLRQISLIIVCLSISQLYMSAEISTDFGLDQN